METSSSLAETISRLRLLNFGAAFVLSLIGWSGNALAQNATLTDVRVALTAPSVGTPEIRAGIKKGFFEKHGLRLILTPLPSGTENIAAAVSGSADIAFADIFAGLNAVSNGFDIKLIVSNHTTSYNVYYLVPKDSPIQTPADFKGKSIALGAVPFYSVFAKAFLAGNGVPVESVKLTLVRQPAALGEALASKQVDAIQSLGVPTFQWIAQYGFRIVGNPDTSGYQNPKATLAAWWATSKWAKSNIDVVRKFSAAVRESYAWWQKLPREERAVFLKEITGVDAIAVSGTLPGALEAVTQSNVLSRPIDIAATEEWVETGKRFGGVPKSVNFEDHVFETAR
jgi:NitT/TauT family transport system substrate-binding protein